MPLSNTQVSWLDEMWPDRLIFFPQTIPDEAQDYLTMGKEQKENQQNVSVCSNENQTVSLGASILKHNLRFNFPPKLLNIDI